MSRARWVGVGEIGATIVAGQKTMRMATMTLDTLKGLYRTGKTKGQELISGHRELLGWIAGLFNAHYRPLYERLTAGSRAAVQRASETLVTPLARAMLSA